MTVFVVDIVTSVLWATLCFLLVLGIKKLSSRYVTKEIAYAFWYVVMFVMVLPMLPLRGISILPWGNQFSSAVREEGTGIAHIPFEEKAIQDFAVPVERGVSETAGELLFWLWLVGVFVVLGVLFYAHIQWVRVKRNSSVPDQALQLMFDRCKKEAGIKRPVRLLVSSNVSSPVVSGLFCPTVLFPSAGVCWKEEEIRFMLLHELGHVKHRDIPVNSMVWLLQALYWFHPLVWRAFSALRQEREQLCDYWVLKQLKEEEIQTYGLTIIHFAGKKNALQGAAMVHADFASSKQGLKKRIESIAAYSRQTFWQKLRGAIVFFCVFLLAVSLSPQISLFAMNRPVLYQSMTEIDLRDYFGPFDGSFVLSVPGQESYLVYHKEMATQRRSPDSTYKIYSALIALSEKKITAQDNRLSWDGTSYPIEAWNQDQTLSSAMAYSANWYFQSLDASTGYEKVKEYFRSIGYGNCDFSGSEKDYWMESSLKISPVEQVTLLEKLNTGRLVFSMEDTQTVKEALKLQEKDGWTLYGKTGTGNIEGKDQNGWFIGWVEKGNAAYYFALNIAGDDNATGSRASEMALTILKDQKWVEKP